MGMKRKSCLFLILLVFLCPQKICGAKKPTLISRITVTAGYGENTLMRTYTSEEKMETVLSYLYKLKKTGRARVDPEQLTGIRHQVTIWMSDGSFRTYRIRDCRYLSEGCEPWETLDYGQASLIMPMLYLLPSD